MSETNETNTAAETTVIGPKGKAHKAPPKPSFTLPSEFKSWEDFGYQGAKLANEAGSAWLAALTARGVDILGDVPEDVMAGMKSGMVQRKAEITPVYWLKREGRDTYGNDKRTTAPSKAERDDWQEFSVAMAMSYSTHQVGQLGKDQPNLKERVVAIRSDVSDYVGNTLRRLKRMAKEAQDGGKAGGRGSNKAIKEVLDTFFKALPDRNKKAGERQDPTAMDPTLLKKKIAAFYAAK